MSKKVRMFAVAANDGIKKTIEEVVSERQDVEIEVRVGNLSNISDIVKDINSELFDVVIARGLTADYLVGKVVLPVVKLGLSGYDILSAIRIAQEYNRKFAIVGFEELITGAELICNLIQYKVTRVTVKCEEEIKEAILSLKSEGYNIMVGGTLTASIAEKMGLNGIFVSSGKKSVETAIQHGIDIHSAYLNKINEVSTLKNIVEKSKYDIVVFDKNRNIIHRKLKDDQNWIDYLKKMLNKINVDKEMSFVKKISGCEYLVKGFKSKNEDNENIVFMIEKTADANTVFDGIKVINRGEINISLPDIIYASSEYMGSVIEKAKKYIENSNILIVYGEAGTEKAELILHLFKNFIQSKNLLLEIDLSCITKNELDLSLNRYKELFTNKDVVISIKNAEHASREVLKKIFNFISQNKYLNYIISANEGYVPKLRKMLNEIEVIDEVELLKIPPLRERTNDIINHVNLYISLLNVKNSKKIIGLQQDAAKVVTTYNWPNNVWELKNAIIVAVKETDTFYIPKEVMEKSIDSIKEKKMNHNIELDLTCTLEDIEKEIVRIVLNEENGSRIKTAERLGISRSKLWTVIKKAEKI